jgi:hypothetical protein
MPTVLGALCCAPSLDADNYNLSVDILPDEGDFEFFGVAVPANPSSGDATFVVPTEEPAISLSGELVPCWGAWYYQGIHVVPPIVDVGNLMAETHYPIEVWNATDAVQNLSAITEALTQGLGLYGPAVPPTDYVPLESRMYDLLVTLDGPGRIDGWYTFLFPPNNPTLHVTGWRISVMGLAPDWSDGCVERMGWLTDVMTAYDGTEQRVRLRNNPRREFEWQYTLRGNDLNRLDALLWGWQSRVYAMPLWMDARFLSASLAAGSLSVPLATQYLGYVAGGLVILWQNGGTFEAIEVASVSPGGVTPSTPTQNSWPSGTMVMPARLARLPAAVSISRVTDTVGQTMISFAIEPGLGRGGLGSWAPPDYQGYDVLTTLPNRKDAQNVEVLRSFERIDFETGAVSAVTRVDHPQIGTPFGWLLQGRAAIAAFLAFLEARVGRWTPFWAPTFQNDIELTRPILPADTQIGVKDAGYERYYDGHPLRRDLAFMLPDRSWLFRRITSVTPGNAGEELLALDAPLGVAVPITGLPLVSFMNLCRLDHDQVDLAWVSDSVATVSVRLRMVPA